MGKAETKLKADRSCAVIFDESRCKDSETHFVIPKDGKGKLCGVSSFNPLSSCKGPNIKEEEEAKGFNQGDYKDQEDRYDRNKLVFTAKRGGDPHWVEELNDDFDDMDEDIESYRCTCNN